MRKLLFALGLVFALHGLAYSQPGPPPSWVRRVTFANLPSNPAVGTVRTVTNTDGAGCNGNGATDRACQWNGSSWVLFGDGAGGGSGDVTDVLGTTNEITVTNSAGPQPQVGIAATPDLSTKVLQGASPLVFEGLTADLFETTVAVTDPTADRTVTVPNADTVIPAPITCGGTDKVSALSSSGVFTCSADQTGAGGLPVVDTTSVVEGSVDATKEIRFEVDGLTTGTIRVLTPLDKNYTLEETVHAAKHQHGGTDEVSTATAGANAIPKAGAGGTLADGWLATKFKTKSLTFLGGCDSCAVLADTDDQATFWRNNVSAVTITSVWCESDGGSPIINLQRDDGTPANILSSNLTCSTTGATGTIDLAEDNLAVGDKLDFLMITAGGVAKRVTVNIALTLD